MKIQIPQKTIPKQVNQGEIFGDIWASWNLDLTSNIGKIRVAPRLNVDSPSNLQPSLTYPVAFIRNLSDTAIGDAYFAICGSKVLKQPIADLFTTPFSVDVLSGSPTTYLSYLYSDGCNFNGSLIVTEGTHGGGNPRILKLTDGVWSTIGSELTLLTPHPVFVGFTNELLIGNGRYVVSIANDFTTEDKRRLVLPEEYEVQWIRGSNSAYWIGARHKYGGIGKVYMWDGASDYVVGDYKINSDITYAGVIKDEICYTVNGNGQLMVFNGGGFVELDRFPITNNPNYRLGTDAIHRNGIAVINDNINVFINAYYTDTSTFIENQLSGIWEYTKDTGLYHKYSITKYLDSNTLDYGSPILNFAGALYPLNTKYGFLAGASLYQSAYGTGQIHLINYIPSYNYPKLGYFITPQLHTQELEDNWQTIYANFSKLLNSGDYIQVKYRNSVNNRITFSGTNTWTDVNKFTTTATEFSTVAVGDEIEVLSGEGSGISATITDITGTGTYTVTIDKSTTGLSGTFSFRISNWTKIDTVSDLVMAYKDFSIQKNSNWIQFKVIMFGNGTLPNSPEIEKLTIVSSPQIKTQ